MENSNLITKRGNGYQDYLLIGEDIIDHIGYDFRQGWIKSLLNLLPDLWLQVQTNQIHLLIVKKNIDQFKKLRLFREFDDPIVEKILSFSDTKEFKVKEVIIEESQELSELYVLMEGRVMLGINVPGKGRINLNTIHSGQLFSWSAMFPPFISTAYAVATHPVKLLAIKSAKLMNMFEEDPSFGFRFMNIISHTLSQRLADTRLQLVNIKSLKDQAI